MTLNLSGSALTGILSTCMSYVLLALAVFGLMTSTVFAGMVLWAVPGYLRERRRALAELEARPGFTPPLTLLKPLHGDEPGLEAHLATFFEQDYPEYEILFCTRSAEDAGLETARRVAARYPQIPAKFLSTGGEPDYINAKVASMERMEAEAALRNSGHQRQRRARYAGLSARRGAAFCRSNRWARCAARIAAWRRRAGCGRGLRPSA